MRRWTEYAYAGDNPVRFGDPDGMGLFDWVKIGSVVKFDGNVHSDEEAKTTYGETATDVTANGQDYIYEGSNGRQVELYSGSFENWDYTDGTKTNTVLREYSAPLEAKGDGLKTAAEIATGVTVANSVNEASLDAAKKLAKAAGEEIGASAKTFGKYVKGLGIVTASISEIDALSNAVNHPSVGSYAKLGVNTILLGGEIFDYVNPEIGIAISIIDATGGTDWVYKQIDKKFPSGGKSGCIGCMDLLHQLIPTSTNQGQSHRNNHIMKKITYFVAAVYQRLNDKDPDTPYLNIRIIIMINLIFHQVQLVVWLKNSYHINLFSNSNFLLGAYLLLLACVIFYICGILFPKDNLEEIEIKESAKFNCYRMMLGYFVLNFSFLMYLLIHYLPINNR